LRHWGGGACLADLCFVSSSQLSAQFLRSDANPAPAPAERTGRGFRRLTRPRRILLALAAVWVLNVFDLGFTLLETTRQHFVEVNPVAATLLHDPAALTAYKSALVCIGSAILLCYRRERVSEMGAWFLLCTYLAVGLRWHAYYEDVFDSLSDPAVNVLIVP